MMLKINSNLRKTHLTRENC